MIMVELHENDDDGGSVWVNPELVTVVWPNEGDVSQVVTTGGQILYVKGKAEEIARQLSRRQPVNPFKK